MLRTSRTARRGRALVTWAREWRLPPGERRAARAEREAERQMKRERDNQESATIRAAAVEAERRKYQNWGPNA